MYLWLDLETTGLDPSVDQILEAAWVTSHSDFNTARARVRSALVTPNVAAYRRIENNPIVEKMHTDSGLLHDLQDTSDSLSDSLYDVETMILESLDQWEADHEQCQDDTNWYLAGSSVQFDLSFVKSWMPRLFARLHYRIMDVTSLENFFRIFVSLPENRAVTTSEGEIDPDGVPHRASYDIKQSMAKATFYFDVMKEVKEIMNTLEELESLGR